MPTTETYTAHDICTEALRKIGVVAQGVPADADEIQSAARALNRMLKAWQAKGYNLWTLARETVVATTVAEHSFASGRPLYLTSVRFKRNGIETPMCRLTREEYDDLPVKDTTGTPTQYYFDRQRDTATMFVWPVLAVANGETLEISYVREIEDVVITEQVDVPSEWYDAVIYGLAARLLDDYTIDAPSIVARSEDELRTALAYDTEDSVFFVDMY